MSRVARVDNIEVLRMFRASLIKFGEAITVALGDAEGEIHRVGVWLENEARAKWESEIRKRHTAVEKCKEAVRMKQLFKDATGRTPSAAEELKALAVAQRKLEEAQQKVLNVKRYVTRLQKETQMYKGAVQRFATDAQAEVPAAAAYLTNLLISLESYVAFSKSDAPSDFDAASLAGPGAMSRGEGIGAGGEVINPWASLRGTVPTPHDREHAERGELSSTFWRIGSIETEDAQAIAALKLDRRLCHPEDWITLVDRVWDETSVFAHRVEQANSRDSGWFIGSTQGTGGKLIQVTAGQLLAVRPDWRALLELPQGTTVVIEGSGVRAVIVASGEDVWKASPHS